MSVFLLFALSLYEPKAILKPFGTIIIKFTKVCTMRQEWMDEKLL